MITALLTKHAIERLKDRLNTPNFTDDEVIAQLNAAYNEVEIVNGYLNVVGYNIAFPYVIENNTYVCKTFMSFARYANVRNYKIIIESVRWTK